MCSLLHLHAWETVRKRIVFQLLKADVTRINILGLLETSTTAFSSASISRKMSYQTAVERNEWHCREWRHCMFYMCAKSLWTQIIRPTLSWLSAIDSCAHLSRKWREWARRRDKWQRLALIYAYPSLPVNVQPLEIPTPILLTQGPFPGFDIRITHGHRPRLCGSPV
jgi:hypothetical protein